MAKIHFQKKIEKIEKNKNVSCFLDKNKISKRCQRLWYSQTAAFLPWLLVKINFSEKNWQSKKKTFWTKISLAKEVSHCDLAKQLLLTVSAWLTHCMCISWLQFAQTDPALLCFGKLRAFFIDWKLAYSGKNIYCFQLFMKQLLTFFNLFLLHFLLFFIYFFV